MKIATLCAALKAGWIQWDETNPPEPGQYFVYHSQFAVPGEKLWTYRPARNKFIGPDKVKWSYKKGECIWFNEGNWAADGPPEFYMPVPKFPTD